MASTRLFHAIVMVGSAMGAACAVAACGATTTDPGPTDGGGDGAGDVRADATGEVDAADTFPGISPLGDTGFPDTRPDTFPTIAVDTAGFKDTGATDTFPGISPAEVGDTFPGISPPPPPS